MKRKEIELFSLSFMDVLFGALGGVIFLFIVVPKGGKTANENVVVPVTLDVEKGKLFGDYLTINEDVSVGDTLYVLATSLGKFPTKKDCPPPIKCPKCPENIENTSITEAPSRPEKKQPAPQQGKTSPNVPYRPSVPSKFSIELHWENERNNVDLYVCKANICVNGKKRENKNIGNWSSGVEINTWKQLFIGKNNLRTNMEAVRQVQTLIPGSYTIQTVFKSSDANEGSTKVIGLIYSEKGGNPKIETFEKVLTLNANQKVTLGTVELTPDGDFIFREN